MNNEHDSIIYSIKTSECNISINHLIILILAYIIGTKIIKKF